MLRWGLHFVDCVCDGGLHACVLVAYALVRAGVSAGLSLCMRVALLLRLLLRLLLLPKHVLQLARSQNGSTALSVNQHTNQPIE